MEATFKCFYRTEYLLMGQCKCFQTMITTIYLLHKAYMNHVLHSWHNHADIPVITTKV